MATLYTFCWTRSLCARRSVYELCGQASCGSASRTRCCVLIACSREWASTARAGSASSFEMTNVNAKLLTRELSALCPAGKTDSRGEPHSVFHAIDSRVF